MVAGQKNRRQGQFTVNEAEQPHSFQHSAETSKSQRPAKKVHPQPQQVANRFAAVVFLPFGPEPFCQLVGAELRFLFCFAREKVTTGGKILQAQPFKAVFILSVAGLVSRVLKCSLSPFWRPSPLILLSQPVDLTQSRAVRN